MKNKNSGNSMQAALNQALPDFPKKVETEASGNKHYRPSRDGQKLIAGHFDPQVAKQLKRLAVEEDTTIQALLEEAINLLLVKKDIK